MTLPKPFGYGFVAKVINVTFYSRKTTRIPGYDYSSCNYYFITICTHNKKCIFGLPDQRNHLGQIAESNISQIESHYENIYVDKYVVMPNHIHMILKLQGTNHNLNQIVGQYKSGVTRQIRKIIPDMKVWQRSFHDHVIRNQRGYEKIWLYIEGNPMNWSKDCFFTD